jgi:hypothetical protein
MGLLAFLQLVTGAATETGLAVPAIFGLIKAVRDAWPHETVDPNDPNAPPKPTDPQLVTLMRTTFGGNHTRNAELQAEILAGNVPAEPPDPPTEA